MEERQQLIREIAQHLRTISDQLEANHQERPSLWTSLDLLSSSLVTLLRR